MEGLPMTDKEKLVFLYGFLSGLKALLKTPEVSSRIDDAISLLGLKELIQVLPAKEKTSE